MVCPRHRIIAIAAPSMEMSFRTIFSGRYAQDTLQLKDATNNIQRKFDLARQVVPILKAGCA
jgi:hypothetical protein